MPHVLFWVGLMTLALPARAAEPIHILAFGDSLTAGYGLPAAESFATQLEKRLQDAGRAVRVTNAGVSGDTTSGGLARLGWSLEEKPRLVILELGANDGLRGLASCHLASIAAKSYVDMKFPPILIIRQSVTKKLPSQ